MENINILWIREERSNSFNGTMIGYKTEYGLCGSFSMNLLETYKKLFYIIDNKDLLKTLNWR
jgi:hypothetical protein